MKTIIFSSEFKHFRTHFVTDVVYALEDETSADYFVATGLAKYTDKEPQSSISKEEVTVNPNLRWAQGTPAEFGIAGRKVLD